MFGGLSNIADLVDAALLFIAGISIILLVGVTGTMLYFVFRYNKKRNPEAEEVSGHLGLEITWTILPTILVMLMFWAGYAGYDLMRSVPEEHMTVKVKARMWSWLFEYENNKTSNTLVVPAGRAIKLSMTSEDVLHSLFIPAFRVKEDTVPGMETHIWFIPYKPGEYDLFCTEYCGVGHSSMITKVKVMKPDEFDAWYEAAEAEKGEKLHPGEKLLREKACIGCHSTDGSKLVGPTFKDIMGRKVTVITDGKERTITVDAEYVEHSIEEPGKDVVKGFPPLMPTIPLTEKEIGDIIDYLSVISGNVPVKHEEEEAKKGTEKAHEEQEKEKVEQSKKPKTASPDGRAVLEERGCLKCHSTDGSKILGPSFKGIMGHKTTVVTNGKERVVTVNADYIKRSIREPNADVVKDFPPVMPPLPLSDEEIEAVIKYLETLK